MRQESLLMPFSYIMAYGGMPLENANSAGSVRKCIAKLPQWLNKLVCFDGRESI